MKIGHIEIFAKDPIKSKDFYIDVLGFELVEIQNNIIVWLKLNDSLVMLRPGKGTIQAEQYQSTNKAFVLYIDDHEKTVNELTSRGLVFKGTDGSDKCLTFTDIDGNWFQLVDPNDH